MKRQYILLRSKRNMLIDELFSSEKFQKGSWLLWVIANPVRWSIVSYLSRKSSGRKKPCVNTIEKHLGIAQPTVSTQLGILFDAGIVESNKKGIHVFYTLVPEKLMHIKNVVDKLNEIKKQKPKIDDKTQKPTKKQ